MVQPVLLACHLICIADRHQRLPAAEQLQVCTGNLHADKRAGILFLDYRTGDTLQLTGECEIRHGTRLQLPSMKSMTTLISRPILSTCL